MEDKPKYNPLQQITIGEVQTKEGKYAFEKLFEKFKKQEQYIKLLSEPSFTKEEIFNWIDSEFTHVNPYRMKVSFAQFFNLEIPELNG